MFSRALTWVERLLMNYVIYNIDKKGFIIEVTLRTKYVFSR